LSLGSLDALRSSSRSCVWTSLFFASSTNAKLIVCPAGNQCHVECQGGGRLLQNSPISACNSKLTRFKSSNEKQVHVRN
jgi:hypothetical protein